MRIEYVHAKDFLSLEDARIVFPSNGLILVSGWNQSLNRANGAGKSSIMQAIAWCWYGEMPRDIKVEHITRRGQASCQVTSSAIIDGKRYTVARKRPSGLELTIDGVKQKGSPKQLQALIQLAIGFTYEQFLVTSYFPQKGDGSRFLKQSDSSAKEFLGTILNFSKADQAYKKLHLQVKDTEVLLSASQAESNALLGSLNSLKSLTSMSIPEMPHKDEVSRVKSEIDLVELKLKNPPDTSDVDARMDRLKKKRSAVEQLNTQVAAYSYQLQQLKNSLKNYKTDDRGRNECPSCGEKLFYDSQGLHVYDEEKVKASTEEANNKIKERINEVTIKLNELQKLQNTVGDIQEQWDKLTLEKADICKEHQLLAERRETLRAKMSSFRKQFEAHQAATQQVAKVKSQIEEAESKYVPARDRCVVLEQELSVLAAAKSVMSPMGAIAYSLDAVISEVNEAVTAYLDIFSQGTMTYKMSSGEDKAKIVHNVSYNEEDVSVGSLSGGEERGLILSVDLGLSEVLAKRCGFPLPSILMLDECFEGLDFVGKEKVLDALREIAKDRCILVVDHHTEFSALFDSMIKVTKIGDVSSVEVL